MKSVFIFSIILFFSFSAWAQEPVDSTIIDDGRDEEELVKPEINPESKLGIKLGTGITTMVGGEPKNPRPAMYLTGGLFGRLRMKHNWSMQGEFVVSLKGSNFNNDPGEYGSIKTYYLEAPVMLLKGLNPNNTSNIVFGLQYSRLLNAVQYKVDGALPESESPGIAKNDLVAIGGAQFHTPFVGFQLLLKYGLLNINDGFSGSLPPLNTGKSVHHITFEVSFIF